jgi:hypothetical protein
MGISCAVKNAKFGNYGNIILVLINISEPDPHLQNNHAPLWLYIMHITRTCV